MRSFVKVLVALALVVVPVRAFAQQSATVAVQNVALRDKPADNGKMLWQLSKGDNVTVLERKGEWTRVRLRVTKGWVRSSTLVVLAGKSAPAASGSAPERRSAAAPERRAEPRRSAARSGRSASDRNGRLGAFRNGDNVLGPAVGLGGVNGTVAVGAELEKGIKTLPELGNGALALSAQAFYYHYSFPLATGASVTTIPLGAAANYHFALKDQRIDPFVGLGLGYAFASVSVPGYTVSSGSGLFFWGRVGARYFVKPNLALHADAGLGMANLNVGVMFRP